DEGNLLGRTTTMDFHRTTGVAEGGNAMVDTARTEVGLGNLEAAAFTQQDVGSRYSYVFITHFGVAVGSVVVTEHVQIADYGGTGGVEGHQDHALLQMLGGIRVGLAHDDGDLAVLVHGSGRPPLGAVDHVLITFAADLALDIGGIRGGNVRLGHGEAGADFPGQQRLEPFLLVLFAAVALDGFHVAGVRR